MRRNTVTITGPESIDDHEYLIRVLNTAIETTENIVALERQRRDSPSLDDETGLVPFDLIGGRPPALVALEQTLPSLTIEDQRRPLNPTGDYQQMTTTDQEDIAEAMAAAADGHETTEILGECPYNARRLYDELRERDITAHIVRGGLDLPQENTRPSSMAEAMEQGVVHWWVEALIDGEWLTLDIASEAPDHHGEELVSPTRPAAYIPFEIDPSDSEMFATR